MTTTTMKKNDSTAQMLRALKEAFAKLDPRQQVGNPVMLMVYISALLTSVLFVLSLFGVSDSHPGFIFAIAFVLWITVLFANFAEAIAEGRGKAQADSLRAAKRDVRTLKLNESLLAKGVHADDPAALYASRAEEVNSTLLKKRDLFFVVAGQQIPADGEVMQGAASVDESAITGESAPVVRESGGDRSSVTGGTTVLSDWLVVCVTQEAGHSFLDQMIAMVESAARKKTPNEIALQILLVALTIVFLLVAVSLFTFSGFSATQAGTLNPTTITSLIALFVCLAPTTIGALLSAIGIAGMSRLNQANVLAMSGRAVEAAGDVDILLLDKTGTITLGNRQAAAFIAVDGATEQEVADAAQLASLTDETPEGRSIVVLAKQLFGIRARALEGAQMKSIPFSASTRMSGVDFDGHEIRKGAAEAIKNYVEDFGGVYSDQCKQQVEEVSRLGGTPLLVARDHAIVGVVNLKDIVKQGIRENFADLRSMGIKTIMITGDNPMTAAAIAAEAGVDDFMAEATPETKLAAIRRYQAEGHLVAMTGDGTNDAPALAQADVAVAMNSGTQAAKEAGNMVDLDSSPTKLLDIVRIGKQLLMTRGSLTTFSIANDIAKYFAIVPALFVPLFPQLAALNIMGLGSPQSAILSAIIYNALIIVALIPLALRGVKYREGSSQSLLARNLLVYGLGGIILPFVFIKLIDVLLIATGLL
ncbi:MAG: potassium-transporting ATPase subunit KdpB [Raoultibacter sp.]